MTISVSLLFWWFSVNVWLIHQCFCKPKVYLLSSTSIVLALTGCRISKAWHIDKAQFFCYPSSAVVRQQICQEHLPSTNASHDTKRQHRSTIFGILLWFSNSATRISAHHDGSTIGLRAGLDAAFAASEHWGEPCWAYRFGIDHCVLPLHSAVFRALFATLIVFFSQDRIRIPCISWHVCKLFFCRKGAEPLWRFVIIDRSTIESYKRFKEWQRLSSLRL